MKKTLRVFAILILLSILVSLAAFFVYYSGMPGFTVLGEIAMAMFTFVITVDWSIPWIAVVSVCGLALLAVLILLIKLIRKKKSFVTYLVLVDIFVIIGTAAMFFLPYNSSTILAIFLNDFLTGLTVIICVSSGAYLIASAITVLLGLVFFILALIDIALTPKFVKPVKSVPEVIAAEVPQEVVVAPEQFVQPEAVAAAPEQYEQPVQPELAPQPEYYEQPAPEAAPQPSPTLEQFRSLIREELARNPNKVDVTVSYAALPPFMGYPPMGSQPQSAPQLQQGGLTKAEVISLIKEEVAKTPIVTKEDIRSIVSAELSHLSFSIIKEPALTPVAEVKPAPSVKPVAVEPAPSPKPIAVEPTPMVKPVAVEPVASLKPTVVPQTPTHQAEIVSVLPEIDEEDPSKNTIIRIPFEERMKVAEKDLLENYNLLKNYILAYGVKSRVSNSGDTFRLHTETYVKITIAGKGLKLYYALDPKSYKDSTIPVSDVSRKSIYAEIPACFKVKSVLSMKRAKQLIDDVMAKKGLVIGKIENVDYAKTFR